MNVLCCAKDVLEVETAIEAFLGICRYFQETYEETAQKARRRPQRLWPFLERRHPIYDLFHPVALSCSGGKDSPVVLDRLPLRFFTLCRFNQGPVNSLSAQR